MERPVTPTPILDNSMKVFEFKKSESFVEFPTSKDVESDKLSSILSDESDELDQKEFTGTLKITCKGASLLRSANNPYVIIKMINDDNSEISKKSEIFKTDPKVPKNELVWNFETDFFIEKSLHSL